MCASLHKRLNSWYTYKKNLGESNDFDETFKMILFKNQKSTTATFCLK